MSDIKANNWDNESVKKFYSENRSETSQLYKSEKYFLDKIDLSNISILDIGCACGGFFNIFREMAPSIKYTGVDISKNLIDGAKLLHPEAEFHVSEKDRLDFPPSSFDLVFSSGVFHMTDKWKELYREAYRVSKELVLIDFRLTESAGVHGKIALDFFGQNCENYADYIVLNEKELFDAVSSLNPAPESVEAYGYMNAPSKMSDIKLKEICMAFLMVKKGGAGNKKTIYSLDLPFENIGEKIKERYS